MTDGAGSTQHAKGFGIAQATNGGTATVNISISGEDATGELVRQLIERMAGDRDAVWKNKIEALTIALSATKDAVEGFLVTLQRQGISPDRYAATLQEIALDYNKLKSDKFSESISDPNIQRLVNESSKLIEIAKTKSDYDDADNKLRKAQELVDESIKRRRTALAEQEKEIEQEQLELAKLSERRALVARLTLQYGEAGLHFIAAAEMLDGTRKYAEKIEYYFEAGRVFHAGGERHSDTSLLRKGVEIFDLLTKKISPNSAELPGAILGLGGCLALIGELNPDSTVELESAANEFERVLSLQGVEARLISMARNNRANVLFHLAKRLTGFAASTVLEMAMRELTVALQEIDKDADPLGWALVAFNKASQTLDFPFTGTDYEASVCAGEIYLLKEVAEIYSAKEFQSERAAALLSLTNGHRFFALYYSKQGNLIKSLAEVEIIENLLDEIQSIWTEVEYPNDWAMAQMNRGAVYILAAQLTSDHDMAARAVDAINRASSVYERLKNKIGWAQTQYNLGLHHLTYGLWGGKPDEFQSAIKAFNNSLTVYLPSGLRDSYEMALRLKNDAIELANRGRSA